MTTDAASIKKQIEFYFSDGNLRRDKFMNDEISKNKDGYFPLETFLKFNRIKALTENVEEIVKALEDSEELELNEEKTMVKRKVAFDDSKTSNEDVVARSLFCDGLDTKLNLDKCRKIFIDIVGEDKLVFVKMRRVDNEFIGSVFVEFKDVKTTEDAKKKIEEKKEELKLDVEMMADWLESESRNKKNTPKKRKHDDVSDKKKDDEREVEYTKGCILKISGVPEGTTREEFKTILPEADQSTVGYVDFYVGQENAKVRFKSPEGATKAKDNEAYKEKFKEIVVMEGDEEKEYWTNQIVRRGNNNRDKKNNNRKGGFHNKKRRR